MTEQPPPAEAMDLAKKYGLGMFEHRLAREIDALCQQCVSAKTKWIVEIIKAIAKQYVNEFEFDTGWRMACGRIMLHICAPTERPAPEGPHGKIGDDASPPAVVDYTKQARELYETAAHLYRDDMQWIATIAAALSAVASEHQAALLARLREPKMREAMSRAHSPALWRRIDELRAIGEPAEDLETEALAKMGAALAAITEKLT